MAVQMNAPDHSPPCVLRPATHGGSYGGASCSLAPVRLLPAGLPSHARQARGQRGLQESTSQAWTRQCRSFQKVVRWRVHKVGLLCPLSVLPCSWKEHEIPCNKQQADKNDMKWWKNDRNCPTVYFWCQLVRQERQKCYLSFR